MRASSRGQMKSANLTSDSLVESPPRDGIRSAKSFVAHQEHLLNLIRTAWPEATAKYLAAAGDISQRQAERVLGRQQQISHELFWSLMESDVHGFRFYWGILDSLTAKWTERERHDREGSIIENMRRELEERERLWRERRT